MDPLNYSNFIKEQKCPNCGGTVRFVPEKGKIVCEFCDSVFDIQPSQTQIQGFDFKAFYEGVPQDDSGVLKVYYCKSWYFWQVETFAKPDFLSFFMNTS